MDDNKTYRIRTNVGKDTVVHFSPTTDIDFLEILSLKLRSTNNYQSATSETGVVVGRVLANGGFGIPNAKVSIFISKDSSEEDALINSLYSYSNAIMKNGAKKRYNLLPDSNNTGKACFQVIGTFPSKRLVLDDSVSLEVFEKYYKLTAVTNQSGDYMIYGVPTGAQTVHVDIDLSDIGVLSQKPIDMIYQGYNINQFNSGSQFKTSDDLETLPQVVTQNQNIDVFPFWGDSKKTDIAISRCDINISYEFKPTCVFMGSTITDSGKNAISRTCGMKEDMGRNSEVVTSSGTIEMIRKTSDGYVEEFPILGNKLINGDGVFCYQIPMNLDYVMTNEEGKLVPTDKPNKGIATRARVRFRFSLDEMPSDLQQNHRGKYLVPNNPKLLEKDENGSYVNYTELDPSRTIDSYYKFGSNTEEEDFKDLYWNKVYSVKNYVPRLQKSFLPKTKKYMSFKAVNYSDSNSPLPYNNLRVDISLRFVVLCIVAKIVLYAITLINYIACIFKASDASDDIDGGEMKTCIPFQVDDESTKVYIPGCRPRRRWDNGQTKYSRYINTLKSFIGKDRLAEFGGNSNIANDSYGIQDGNYKTLYIKDCKDLEKDGEIVFTGTWGVRLCDRSFIKSKNGGGFRTGDKGPDGYNSQSLINNGIVRYEDDEVILDENADVDTWMLDTTPFDKMNVELFFKHVKQYILADSTNRYNTYYGSVMAVWLGTAWYNGYTLKPNKDDYKFRSSPTYRRLFREFGYGWSDVWDILQDYRYMLDMVDFKGIYVDDEDNEIDTSVTPVTNETKVRFGIKVVLSEAAINDGDDRATFSKITPRVAFRRIHERDDRMYVWSRRNRGVFKLTEVTDLIESTLADQEEVVKLNFSNDWVNGMLYFPMWEMRRTRKRSIGNWTWGGRELFCECKDKSYRLKLYNTCSSALNQTDNTPNYNGEIEAGKGGSIKDKTISGDPKDRSTALYRLKRYVRLKGGVIKKVQNRDGYNIYYYTLGNFIKRTNTLKYGKTDSEFAPLFATDIILLGSLDENDLHGVPQLFDHLSPTSSNIPPMRTEYDVTVDPDDNGSEDDDPENDTENQYVSMTGIDFSHRYPYDGDASVRTVQYGNGLFTNITCFNAYTISKSCVNARRMCELGVSGDATYGMETTDGENGRIKYADGFVSYFDVTDPEARTMFATMNFGNLNSKVFDKYTGYNNPQFQYLSPFAFNGPGRKSNDYSGSLQSLQEARKNFRQLPYYDVDFNDEHYSVFRNGHNSVKPKFLDYTGRGYGQMPYYQNSFYFYFGLNNGKTAYDEFVKTYYSTCPKVEKDTIVFDAYVTYKNNGGGMYYVENGTTKFNTATIHVDISRVTEPYSIKIVRKSDNTTVFDADEAVLHSMNLVFNGYFSGNTANFSVYTPESDESGYQITDDRYIVTISDTDGGTAKQIVTVERIDHNGGEPGDEPGDEPGGGTTPDRPVITCSGVSYTVATGNLKKQYLPPLSDMEGINNESKVDIENSAAQGTLNITSMGLAGDNYTFSSVRVSSTNSRTLEATTTGGHTVLVTLETIDGTSVFEEADYLSKSDTNQGAYFTLLEGGAIGFRFFRPCLVGLKFELVVADADNPECRGYYTIQNCGSMDGFINDVPAAFVMGNKYDLAEAYDEVGMLGNLYNAQRHPNTIDGLDAFFHLDEEKTYKFYATDKETSRYHWGRFITDYDSTINTGASYLTKRELMEVAKAKFVYMMNMMAATNIPCTDIVSMSTVCSDEAFHRNSRTFKYSVPPQITADSDLECFYTTVSSDNTECENTIPHIVGRNYCKPSKHTVNGNTYSVPVMYNSTSDVPFFNPAYQMSGDTSEIGTYMGIRDTYINDDDDNVIEKDLSIPAIFNTDEDSQSETTSNYRYAYERVMTEAGDAVASYPMYKHISVDRRLDYDLDIVLPVSKADGSVDTSVMNGGYIAGSIINGIEMDYDEGRVITGRCVVNSNQEGIPSVQTITIGFNQKFIDDYVHNYSTPYDYAIYKKAGEIYTALLLNGTTVATVAAKPGVTVIGTTRTIYNVMKEKIAIYTSQTQHTPAVTNGLYMYYAGPNVEGGAYVNGKFYVGASDSCCNIHWVEIDKSEIYIDFEESFECTYTEVSSIDTGIYYEYTLNSDATEVKTEWVANRTSLKKRLYEACVETTDGTTYDMRDDLVKTGRVPSDGTGNVAFNNQLWTKTATEKGISVTGNFGKDSSNVWTYPTRRGVSSVGLPVSDSYKLKFASCSYEPHAVLDEYDIITAKTSMCDENVINIPYSDYFDYSQFNANASGSIGNKSRFIVKLKDAGNGVYRPDEIRELVYINKLNSAELNTHSIHIKKPCVVQTDANALSAHKDTFNEWISAVARKRNELGVMFTNAGVFKQETMAINAPSDGVYNLSGYTACDESKTKNDLISNIAVGSSTSEPLFNPIKLDSNYPYVFITDERMYVNNTGNRLLQRAKVIRVSDIYKLDSVTVSNLSANGNTVSCAITTDRTENRNPLIDILSVKVYNTVDRKYLDNVTSGTYITSSISGSNKAYSVIVTTNVPIGAGCEAHIITKSGVTYALSL